MSIPSRPRKFGLLTNHGYGVGLDDVLRQLDVGRVAYHHDVAAGAIYVERHVRRGDPAALRCRLGSRGVALEIVSVHGPLDVSRRIRVLRGAGDHHLFVSLRFRGSGDRHSGWRDCKTIVVPTVSESRLLGTSENDFG